MATVRLRNLGSVGVISDVPEESLPVSAFTSAQNISFFERSPHKARGYRGNSFGALPITPYGILAAQGPLDYSWLVMGLTKIYAYFNGSLFDVTRSVGGDYTASVSTPWTGTWVNGVSVVNNSNDVPQYVGTIDANAEMADLPNWPTAVRCENLTNFKNYFLAMNVTKNYGDPLLEAQYPTLLKWSHPADPGNVPPSWDETDAAYLAGEFPLSVTPGALIDGLQSKNTYMLYKNDAVIAMTETGDNDVFRFDPISLKFGVPSVNCVAEIKPGVHAFWNQHGDMMINNGQTVTSIATNRIRRRIQKLLNFERFYRSFVLVDIRNTEVLFCFPAIDADYCNYAITWNWEENTFGERELPPMVQAREGKFDLVAEDIPTWDELTTTEWDAYEGTWDGTTGNLTSNRILGVSAENTDVYILSEGYTAAGESMVCRLERVGLPIAGQTIEGEITLDPAKIKVVTRVWPLLSAPRGGTFEIRIGAQDDATSSVTWQGPFIFDPAVDNYIEPFIEGKYLSYQIVSRGDEEWRLDGLDFELHTSGILF